MKKFLSMAFALVIALSLTGCGDNTAEKTVEKTVKNTPDYSQKSSWYQIPEITKDVDTFYILATEYMGFNEGAPNYAAMDEPEMVEGAPIQYAMNASAFEESTNVFLPFYRQSSLKYAGEVWRRDGNGDAAISGIPYEDITAALDYEPFPKKRTEKFIKKTRN